MGVVVLLQGIAIPLLQIPPAAARIGTVRLLLTLPGAATG